MNKSPYIHIAILVAFLINTFGPMPVVKADEFRLPVPGVMVRLSPEFNPPVLKGIKVYPDNPFRFDFILDRGDSRLSNNALKGESSKLIKYFLTSLTIPEKDLWVNLSPYEKDRIIPRSFGLTEMGRDLLAEDYMLKQITASLIYPEDEIGKKFWKRVYEEATKKYGTTNIPVNTFNKVWIIPDKSVVYENTNAGTAYVVKSTLKVMLEQDYLALSHNVIGIQDKNDINAIGSQIVREIVIPELTKEVNENKNFVQLRQVYDSLILATWYKKKIKDSILSQVYADKNKVQGLVIPAKAGIQNKNNVEHIYQQYLKAFKKGAYNYIKEEQDPVTQQVIPRKYFSGGFSAAMIHVDSAKTIPNENPAQLVEIDAAMRTSETNTISDGVLQSLQEPISEDEVKAIFHSMDGVMIQGKQKKYLIINRTRFLDGRPINSFLIENEGGVKHGAIKLGEIELNVIHDLEGNMGLEIPMLHFLDKEQGQGILSGFLEVIIERFKKHGFKIDFINFTSITNEQTLKDILEQIESNVPLLSEKDRGFFTDIDRYIEEIIEQREEFAEDYDNIIELLEQYSRIRNLNDLIKSTPLVRVADKLGFKLAVANFNDKNFNITCSRKETPPMQEILYESYLRGAEDHDQIPLFTWETPEQEIDIMNFLSKNKKTVYDIKPSDLINLPKSLEAIGQIEGIVYLAPANLKFEDLRWKGSRLNSEEIRRVEYKFLNNIRLDERGNYRGIADISAAQGKLFAHQAEDPLTKLPSRSAYVPLFRKEILRETLLGGKIAVALLDLDKFKEVNDKLGHKAGDDLLKECAKIFKRNIRATDHVIRLGGDEFVFIIPTSATSIERKTIVERMRLIISKINKIIIPNLDITIGASIGVAVYTLKADQILSAHDIRDLSQKLLKAADDKMYKIKQNGKNDVENGEFKIQEVENTGAGSEINRAMNAQVRGGIDLTPARMNLQTQMDSRGNDIGGIRFHLDPAMLLKYQNSPGFEPDIIKMRPVTDLRSFLTSQR